MIFQVLWYETLITHHSVISRSFRTSDTDLDYKRLPIIEDRFTIVHM